MRPLHYARPVVDVDLRWLSAPPPLRRMPRPANSKAALCIGCHGISGYQASFPEMHKVPMIAGQNAPYIVAALTAYKKGERLHPTMKGIAATLTDQDMADLAAFYENQAQGASQGTGRSASGPVSARRRAAEESQLLVVPRRELQQADRTQLPEDRRPACRLPLRRTEVVPDRWQPASRPQERDHGRHGAPVHARRAEGNGEVPRLDPGRSAHGAAAPLPLS